LFIAYHPLDVTLISVCWYSIENFDIYIHQGYWPAAFFQWGLFSWLWHQDKAGLIKWIWKHSFLLTFLEEFEKDCSIFFKCLVEFTNEFGLQFPKLEDFDYWFNVSSEFLFLHDLVLVGYIFLGTCLFLLGYPICWHIIIHSYLLESLKNVVASIIMSPLSCLIF
jgi:hypothetical protein